MRNDLGSSEYLHKVKQVEFSPAPCFDIEEEFQLHELVKKLIRNQLVQSVHDISEGGLLVNLMESAFQNNLGFDVQQTDKDIRPDAFWFGESQSRVVMSADPEKLQALQTACGDYPFTILGAVTENSISIDDSHWQDIAFWKNLYDTAIEKYMSGKS
jgi:phosphoribosylformylglycinamidine synthase